MTSTSTSTSTSPSPSPSNHVFHQVNFQDENQVTLVRNKLTAHLPETLPLLYAFNNAHRTLTTSTSSSITGIATPCWWYSTCDNDSKEMTSHDIKAIVGRLAMASLALSPWCVDEKDGIPLLTHVLHLHHVPDKMIKHKHHTTSTPSDNPFTHITLSAILDRLKPMVMDVCNKCYHDGMTRIGKKLDMVIGPEGDGLFYLPSRASLNVVLPTSTTMEFTVTPLTVDDAVTVNHHWPYGSTRTLPYVQECITQYQTAGIRVKQEDGTMYLVAWALEQPYGGLGMVFTRPEYRRRGLSGIIVCHLLLQLYELDSTRIPFVYIKHGNIASEQLFTALGFKHVSAVSWDSVEFFDCDASNGDSNDALFSDSKQQQQ